MLKEKATARVPAHHPSRSRLYYERRYFVVVVIVEAGEEGMRSGDPCGRLPILHSSYLFLLIN